MLIDELPVPGCLLIRCNSTGVMERKMTSLFSIDSYVDLIHLIRTHEDFTEIIPCQLRYEYMFTLTSTNPTLTLFTGDNNVFLISIISHNVEVCVGIHGVGGESCYRNVHDKSDCEFMIVNGNTVEFYMKPSEDSILTCDIIVRSIEKI